MESLVIKEVHPVASCCLKVVMSWSISLSSSLIRAVMSSEAFTIESPSPLMVTTASSLVFNLSKSILAPLNSLMALMLQPPLPITLLTAFAGTSIFLIFFNCSLLLYELLNGSSFL